MGESRKLVTVGLALLAAMFLCGHAAASPVPVDNPWLNQRGILNMAHQGGEFEAPSSTMYAFRTALESRGADSLEFDVNATSDNRLAVMHDYYTNKITPLDAQVRDVTLAELQALDAAYWYRPGTGQFNHSRPANEYPFRGVRSGDIAPPQGFTAEDFRVPAVEQVLSEFADVPLNIENKTAPGEPGESIRVATLLAEVLNRPEYRFRRIIVASLDQNALVKFHELAPGVDVSASLGSMIAFMSGASIEPEPVALQVPMQIGTFEPPLVLKDMDVAGMGYAVHAWTDGAETENDDSYAHLIGSGVQGIMTSSPAVLHDYLCRSGIRRPDGFPRCESQVMKFRLDYPSRSLRRYLTEGLPVRAHCDQACFVTMRVLIRVRTARRLGIEVTRSARAAGEVRIGNLMPVRGAPRVGLNVYRAGVLGKPLKRLARVKRVRIRIATRMFDGEGMPTSEESRWLTLTSKKPLRPRR